MQKGTTHTDAAREKMSAARKGKAIGNTNHSTPHSAEAKEKMRQARIAYWVKKKGEQQ